MIEQGEIGKLVHIDVQFVVNFSGYDEGVRSKMHDPTPMFEDQRFVRFSIDFHCFTTVYDCVRLFCDFVLRLIWVYFDEQDSDLGGGAMMDLGCYCISALRNLSPEEPVCTAATADVWDQDAEIDLGMSADFVYPSGATAHFDNSFVGGDKAGPVVVTVTGSKGTLVIENYNGGGNAANSLTVTLNGAEPTVETVDTPPNTRSTMYYQMNAFVDEVRACEAAAPELRAKPWAYSLKPSPSDAVANMAVLDGVCARCRSTFCITNDEFCIKIDEFCIEMMDCLLRMMEFVLKDRKAGMAPRRTTATLPA